MPKSKYIPKSLGVKYIDAKDHIAGRLASKVAKLALLGYEVHIVNSEKVVITGKKQNVLDFFKNKIERGDWYKGPFYPKRPDRILKRIIRGMLPWKNWRGRIAYKRIKTYLGVPIEFRDKEFEKYPDAMIDKLKRSKRPYWYVYLEDIAKQLGAKIIKVEDSKK